MLLNGRALRANIRVDRRRTGTNRQFQRRPGLASASSGETNDGTRLLTVRLTGPVLLVRYESPSPCLVGSARRRRAAAAYRQSSWYLRISSVKRNNRGLLRAPPGANFDKVIAAATPCLRVASLGASASCIPGARNRQNTGSINGRRPGPLVDLCTGSIDCCNHHQRRDKQLRKLEVYGRPIPGRNFAPGQETDWPKQTFFFFFARVGTKRRTRASSSCLSCTAWQQQQLDSVVCANKRAVPNDVACES